MPAPKDPIKYKEWLEKLSQGHRRNPSKYWLGKKHSEEYKQNMSKSCKGKHKHSEEWKKKRSLSQMGENNSAKKVGVGEKISKALTGRKLSEETKRKIGIAVKGRIVSEETRNKISIANKGKISPLRGSKRPPFSEETKKKMRDAQKGKKISDEQKKKQSISMSGNKNPFWGRTHTEETRKKMKLNNKNYVGMKGKKHSEETKQKLREFRITNPNRIFKDTKIELRVEKELQKRNINYEKQVPICRVALVDFYLPEFKTIIQCDGCYWHGCPIHHPNKSLKQKNKDINQDFVLFSSNFKIYRFWEHEINESVERCLDKISLRTIV